MISITVQDLLKDHDYALDLSLVAGQKGLSKKILIPQIQKPGLALTGYTANLHPGRIQVLGNSEIHFLNSLPPSQGKTILGKIAQLDLACFVVTKDNAIPEIFEKNIAKRNIPILRTPLTTAEFILRVTRFLQDRLTETTSLHGVLLDVFGVGVLLMGKSGIGKSECALELVMKGHRLVTDDIVNLRKRPPDALYGYGSDLIKYHMEIRGLGIINIKDLFGVTSVRDQKLLELIIELVDWHPKQEYDRLGIDQRTFEILGIKLPFVQLPVRPGRSLTTIIEVAARNHLMKLKGYYSAQEFQAKLTRQLLWGQTKSDRKRRET